MNEDESRLSSNNLDHWSVESIRKLLKIEVHAHLNGSIRESTLFELAKERGITLNQHHFSSSSEDTPSCTSSSALDQSMMYNVRPRSLLDCFEMFTEIGTVVDDLVAIRRITLETLQDFANDGCIYLELRSTPKCLQFQSHLVVKSAVKQESQIDSLPNLQQTQLATKHDYCETIIDVMKEFQKSEGERYAKELEQISKNQTTATKPRPPMICSLIVSVDRSQSVEAGWENIGLAIQLHKKYPSIVVGVDLGGNPLKRNFIEFQVCFEKARQEGLFVTLHCAEVLCIDDDKDSKAYQDALQILNFGPDRLGHALLLPPSLQKMLQELKIPVETCPTSNVMTIELAEKSSGGSLIEGLKRHPQLQKWLFETNHPVCICTDDPGVFHTTASKELFLLQEAYGIEITELKNIIIRSVDYICANHEIKNLIKKRIMERSYG